MTTLETQTAAAQTNGLALPTRPDYAGYLEVWKPPTDNVFGQFDLKIEDPEGIQPPDIIKSKHPVRVICDLWLYGDIWKCVVGYFNCDVCFRPLKGGEAQTFDLRDRFVGCEEIEDGRVHFRMTQDLDGSQFVAGDTPAVWEVTAALSFENECGERGTISGFDITHVQVYPEH